MDVDIVDFSAPTAAQAFVRSLRATGFAAIVNHPLPMDLVARIYEEWLGFFASDSKFAYTFGTERKAGYFPYEAGLTLDGTPRDRKEYFQVYASGIYPKEVSDAASRYMSHATGFAENLLAWIEDNSPDNVKALFSVPLPKMLEASTGSVLRIQHYLPLDQGDRPVEVRALAHQDLDLLTVLPAPTGPGLQVKDVEGVWRDVPCDAGSVIINTGEMLQDASGGYYPATPHRVVNPVTLESAGRQSRVSLPLFLYPRDDVLLSAGRTTAVFLRDRIEEFRKLGWRPTAGAGELKSQA